MFPCGQICLYENEIKSGKTKFKGNSFSNRILLRFLFLKNEIPPCQVNNYSFFEYSLLIQDFSHKPMASKRVDVCARA